MATITYIAFLTAAPEGGYGVHFADLPGCVSFGDDLDEAVAHAGEALALHLEGMAEDGEEFPAARSLAEIAQGGDLPDAPFVYAAISAEPEGSERVNVYLPKSLIAQMEAFGKETGMDNRSTLLRMAARQFIVRERGRADRIPRINADIRWQTDDRLRVRKADIYDRRFGEDDAEMDSSNGACCAGWMTSGDPRQTPEGVFAEMMTRGFEDAVAQLQTLREFEKIDGCDWAAGMADAIEANIKSDEAAVEHWAEIQAEARERARRRRWSGGGFPGGTAQAL